MNNNILVTGGSGGIGRAVCKYFAQKGYSVFSLDVNLPKQKINNVVDIECDITDENCVKSAFQQVSDVADSLKAVINLAGVYRMNSLIEMEYDAFKRSYEINLYGAFLVNKIFFPLYSTGGRVIIVTSELATQKIMPFNGIYMMNKSALDKYAQGLRAELSLLGIKVVTVRPGAIDTGMIDVSNQQMYKLCESSTHYQNNTKKFYKIMNSVSSKSIAPEKLAKLIERAVTAKRVKNVYTINNSRLLKAFSLLPEKMRNLLLKKILK